jgi:hypothetical protein
MSWRRLALTAMAVFVAKAAVGAVSFGLLLDDLYDSSSPVFRPEGEERHGIGMVGELAWAIAFAYLFMRYSGRRGWTGAIRFGLVAWAFYFVPMTLGVFGYFAVDASWALAALAVGLVEALSCGALAAAVQGGREPVPGAA